MIENLDGDVDSNTQTVLDEAKSLLGFKNNWSIDFSLYNLKVDKILATTDENANEILAEGLTLQFNGKNVDFDLEIFDTYR